MARVMCKKCAVSNPELSRSLRFLIIPLSKKRKPIDPVRYRSEIPEQMWRLHTGINFTRMDLVLKATGTV